jgi:hypothetical protein
MAVFCHHRGTALDAGELDMIVLRALHQSPDVPVTQRNMATLRLAAMVGRMKGNLNNLCFSVWTISAQL